MLKKTILLGLTAVLMTACGTNDSGGVSSSGGSGECVDMPSPENLIGLTQRQKTTIYQGDKVIYSKIESNELESYTKSSSKTIVYDDNENEIGAIEEEHSITDGLIRITKIIYDFTSSSGVYSETDYEPYNTQTYKIGKNCKGDTWESKYTSYDIVDGKKKEGTKSHRNNTIEEVNVEKTVTAGTFNTVKVRTEGFVDVTSYVYEWRDIDTGFPILLETYKQGKLSQRFETLDIY